jgi:hypothetical protein
MLMRKRIFYALFTLLIFPFFVSCQENTKTIAIPHILSHLPKFGDANVSIKDSVKISVSANLLPLSVNPETVLVRNNLGEKLESVILYDDLNKIILIQPKFPAPNKTNITVTANVKSIEGVAFQEESFPINYNEWLYLDSGNIGAYTFGGLAADFAIDSNGNPTLFYMQNNALIVKKFQSNIWNQIGGNVFVDQAQQFYINSLKIFIDKLNNIWVFWLQKDHNTFDGGIKFAKFDGVKWTNFDSVSGANKIVEYTASSFDNGTFFVSYIDFERKIQSKIWDGITWTQLGNPVNQDLPQVGPTFLVKDITSCIYKGQPIVSWVNDFFAPKVVRVSSWNGSSWQVLGNTPSISENTNYAPFVQCNMDKLFVTWSEESTANANQYNLRVKEWLNNSWMQIGSELNGSLPIAGIGQPSITINPDLVPYVSYWQGDVNGLNYYINRYENAKWNIVHKEYPNRNGRLSGDINNKVLFDKNLKLYFLGMDDTGVFVATPNK